MNKVTRGSFVVIYAITVIASIAANYPGRINPDTTDMLWQAHNVAAISDWHSPFCTFVFGFLGPLFGYPGGALVVQSLLMMTWPSYVFASLLRWHTTIYGTLLLGLWCVVTACFVALCGEIIKDYLVVALLSCIFFVVSNVREDEDVFRLKKLDYIVVLICLVSISVIRAPVNILLIILPAFVAACWFIGDRRKLRLIGIAVGSLMVVSIVAMCLLDVMFWAKHSDGYLPGVSYDIGGMSVLAKQDFFSEMAGTAAPQPDKVAACYSPRSSDDYLFKPGCDAFGSQLRSLSGSVIKHWLSLILRHPVKYFVNRSRFATWLLYNDGAPSKRIVSYPPWYLTTLHSDKEVSAYAGKRYVEDLQLWKPTISYIPFGVIAGFFLSPDMGQNVLCQPALWGLILIAGFIWAAKNRTSGMTLPLAVVSVFGLTNIVIMILFSGTDCLRYLVPTWMSALAALVLMFRHRLYLLDRSENG